MRAAMRWQTMIMTAALLWLATPQTQTGHTTPAPIHAVVVVNAADACEADPDHPDVFVRVDMKLRLRLENVGTEPLILPRAWRGDEERDAADIDQLLSKKWDSLVTLDETEPKRPNVGKKPPSQFQTLKVGQAAQVPLNVSIFLTRPGTSFTFAAQVVVKGVFRGWTDDDLRNAGQRWTHYGQLWTTNVTTEPFTVTAATSGKWRDCP